ncbi:MAG: phage minor head protein [Sphingomonadaceae bacterium]
MADDRPTIRAALDLPPDDALRAFRARDELGFSVSWRDFEPEEHARAFTVAKIARLDLLSTVRESLDRALAEGQTFEQWRARIEPELRRAGWWGLVQDPALTGTSDPVFVGERRLRTIFATNMRVSRAAGQWARIQAAKDARPWLRYSAVLDNRTRPQHAAWHGIILPVDHPFWRTHFPPNGWNCRCQVIQLSDRDLERQGWSPTPEDRLPPMDPTGGMYFGQPRAFRAKLPGIDHGWNYNPGAESLMALAERAEAAVLRAEAAGLAEAAEETRGGILDALGLVLGVRLGQLLARVIAGSRSRTGGLHHSNRQNRDRGKFADEGRRLQALAEAAEADPKRQVTHDLGVIDRSNVEAVAAHLRIDLSGYRRRIRDDYLRHALLSHGLSKKERMRGQVALTTADLRNLPGITRKPDFVSLSGKLHHGRQVIEYTRTIGGRRYVYVEAIDHTHSRVEFLSLRAHESDGSAGGGGKR